MTNDLLLDTFCSDRGLDIFHSVTHHNQIWLPDRYDVERIHQEARVVYERLLNRVDSAVPADSGRILLLLGESGAGKTHLMRVFRNQTHQQGLGYFSYMQMTSVASNYARYVLRNTIDSLDKPYCEALGTMTGLMRLSNALAESPQVIAPTDLTRLREADLTSEALMEVIYPVADRVVSLEPFTQIDIDLIRALLYLQPGQPALNARIFKFLRCEPLSSYDSKTLGGLPARAQEDDPLRMMQSLARLIGAISQGALVICLDQLEDIHQTDQAEQRFRRAIQATVTLAEIPNVVVILSCLDDFYIHLKQHLSQTHLDRVELDPPPVTLTAQRSEAEIKLLIAHRLQHLYDLAEISPNGHSPLYPFPEDAVSQLTNKRTRDVLDWCRHQREVSITTGQPPKGGTVDNGTNAGSGSSLDPELSQYWNDHRAGSFLIPEEEVDCLQLLETSLHHCAHELGQAFQFLSTLDEDTLTLEILIAQEQLGKSLRLALCQKSASGGALAKQIKHLERRATGQIPVALRSTDFPSNPKTQIAQYLGQFLGNGGRRAVITDSDWRTMAALQAFQQDHGNHPHYQQWLQTERPLSQLSSIQAILDLNRLNALVAKMPSGPPDMPSAQPHPPAATPSPTASPSPSLHIIPLGYTRDYQPQPVTLSPDDLVRHAAFLGGSGSGKTTLALALIEQLLLRGIPAILLDRKGDLCSYANPAAWSQPCPDPDTAAERQRLQEKLEVAVFTPGTMGSQGRPLSISITPTGLGQLPSDERQQIANYCAMALGGILNYKSYGQDKTRMAILGQAIAVLSQLQTDNPLSINRLIDFIADEDPLLINAIGVLDPKHCKKLAEDLQTLSLISGHLFSPQHEQLSVETLLGKDKPNADRTRLSIINLACLGDNANILFWVAQLLLALNRYAKQSPSDALQAVVLFDEADLYLPAQSKPSTKEPMENLLKRARSAGLGLLLATQSPGDLDYKCRDQISSWFVGKVKENTALNKLKPMLSEARVDVTSKLANQQVGEFYALRAGEVVSLKANRSLVTAVQVSAEEILSLAADGR
jgi:GTPase SAR1 family protein